MAISYDLNIFRKKYCSFVLWMGSFRLKCTYFGGY